MTGEPVVLQLTLDEAAALEVLLIATDMAAPLNPEEASVLDKLTTLIDDLENQ